MQSRDYFLSRKFKDAINYPYGFSRAGDFSLAESKVLESLGSLCAALMNHEVSDMTIEDEKFVRVIEGLEAPTSDIERIWLKYQKLSQKNIVVLRPNRVDLLDDNDMVGIQ